MAQKQSQYKKSNSEFISITRDELNQLRRLAAERAEQTATDEDDLFLEDLDNNISDMGDSADDPNDRRWELDENPIIDSIRHELRRELRSPDGRWYRPAGVKPVVNRIGEHDILGIIRSNLTKNIAMGNISRTEANRLTHDVVEALIEMIVNNWRKWELDKSYRDWVVSMTRNHVYLHMTRPINEGERKYRGGSKESHFNDDFMFKDDKYYDELDFNNNRSRTKNKRGDVLEL